MKKLFLFFWALLATTALWAHDFEVDGIYYNILDGNSVEVTYCGSYPSDYSNEYSSSVEIPGIATHNGTTYSVTSIGERAFSECSYLTSVTIPSSVASIGDDAFYYCKGLTSVAIPNSVTSIGSYVFYGCDGLTTPIYNAHYFIYLPTSYSGTYTIPDGIKQIAGGAFAWCSGLTSVTIPNSVTNIGRYAFDGCSSLTSPVYNAHSFAYLPTSYEGTYTIPDGIKQIAGGAFSGCFGLTSITIPNSVTTIEEQVFSNCQKLTSVTIPNGVTTISDGAFVYCKSLKSLTIPSSVTSIGNSAFFGCSALTSISIPNSVTNIGSYAFRDCSSLSTPIYNAHCFAYLPTSYKGAYAIPDGIKQIVGGAFYGSSGLTSITIPNSVTTIGEYAFCNCSGLTSVEIPNSVTIIGDGAFCNCSGLTSVTIPNSVTSIWPYAFFNCSALASVIVETNTPPTIGDHVFSSNPVCTIPCGTKSAYEASAWAQYMGELVEYIPELTSGFCGENLYWEYADTKLSISGEGAMYDNIVECLPWAWLLDSIRSIEISEGITHIAAYAFDGCSALRELHLPASVQSIGEYAFGNTPRLYEITCLAPEPPVADISSFTNYDAYLHAYCDAQRYYSIDPVWKNFHNVECIVTENEVTGDVTITPSDYEATVVWLSHADAAAYALVITKNDVTFCTLKFNKYGQLTNIAFAPSRTHRNKQQAAEATSTGYSFTITGLDENTTYGYAFSVLNEESAVIEEFVGEFTTQSNVSTAVDNVDASNHSTQKLLRDGNLVIIRDGVEYNVMGQQL